MEDPSERRFRLLPIKMLEMAAIWLHFVGPTPRTNYVRTPSEHHRSQNVASQRVVAWCPPRSKHNIVAWARGFDFALARARTLWHAIVSCLDSQARFIVTTECVFEFVCTQLAYTLQDVNGSKHKNLKFAVFEHQANAFRASFLDRLSKSTEAFAHNFPERETLTLLVSYFVRPHNALHRCVFTRSPAPPLFGGSIHAASTKTSQLYIIFPTPVQ